MNKELKFIEETKKRAKALGINCIVITDNTYGVTNNGNKLIQHVVEVIDKWITENS